MVLPRSLTRVSVEQHGERVRWWETLHAAGCRWCQQSAVSSREVAGALTLCFLHCSSANSTPAHFQRSRIVSSGSFLAASSGCQRCWRRRGQEHFGASCVFDDRPAVQRVARGSFQAVRAPLPSPTRTPLRSARFLIAQATQQPAHDDEIALKATPARCPHACRPPAS